MLCHAVTTHMHEQEDYELPLAELCRGDYDQPISQFPSPVLRVS